MSLIAEEGSSACVSHLADKVNLSRSHFSRLFRKCAQTTAVKYRNLLRLQKAETLLLNSWLSIKQVMAACGYNDRSYFSREFKKRFGVAPSLYRKQKQATNNLR